MTSPRQYGAKYTEERLSAAEIASRIRADIKEAVRNGSLPDKPVQYRVTCQNFSGGRAVDVLVVGLPDAWTTDVDHFNISRQKLTDAAKQVQAAAETIRWAYNYDESDSQADYFNVNYYGGTTIEDESSRRFREDEEAKRKTKRDLGLTKPRVDKRGLSWHLMTEHRASGGFCDKRNFATLTATHNRIHARGNTAHVHETEPVPGDSPDSTCYPDHTEDVRTKGSCGYCGGTT